MQEYYETIKPRRVEYLRGLITAHIPKVVIGYGKAFWHDYRALFEGCEFMQEDQFQKAVSNNTLVILTGHVTARIMNDRFDKILNLIKSRINCS